eukprot:4535682-Pleurochrysis_carterae.AAC.1
MKLRWEELPRCQSIRQQAYNNSSRGVSSLLEYSPVNPVVGPGRTAADVQRELHAHQNTVRASQPEGTPAVYQTDFLFVQLTRHDLQLHRVCNNSVHADALDPDIRFSTTEYVDTPQLGYPGFWGTFEMKLNPMYDSKDPHKGPMHIRHHFVGRENIKKYSVKTFVDKMEANGVPRAKTVVRVTYESIRKITEICSTLPPIPDEIPDTHLCAEPGAAAGQQSSRGTSGRRAASRGRGGGRGHGGGGRARCGRTGVSLGAVGGPQNDSSEEEESSEDSSDEEEGAASTTTAAQAEEQQSAEDNDDFPPPILPGFEQCAWDVSMRVAAGQSVMIWTALSRRGRSAPETWHQARIQRELTARSGISASFTHAAGFATKRHPRGIVLSAESYEEGCWVLLKPVAV